MGRLLGCAGLALLLALGGVSAQGETVDGVVATVGPEVILQSELMQEIAPTLVELRKSAASEADFNKAAEQQLRLALEQAIEYKILLREALMAGLEVTDDQVEARIADIKKRFASAEEFNKELTAAGETVSDFRKRIRKQILAISMGMRKRKEFEKAAEVTEADVAQYYQDNSSKFTHPERVQVRRIFLPAGSDGAEQAKVKARLADLKTQIDGGADFVALAKSNSTGPDAAEGGLLGWVVHNDLVPNLEAAAFGLPVGGVSDVLQTEYGFVLLKVEKKEPAGTAMLDDARTEIEPALRAKFADEKYKKWISELRKRSRVRVLI